jgi:uncharacterized protein
MSMTFRATATIFILILSLLSGGDSPSGKTAQASDLIKTEVAALVMNEEERSVLLVLRPEASGGQKRRVLPLVIGLEEARSIYVAHNDVSVPRPLTHDLMKMIIEQYGGSMIGCVITKMERATFYAELRLKKDGREITIDCRPSDAIALALRAKSPIYVARAVMDQHGVDPNKPEQTEKPVKT